MKNFALILLCLFISNMAWSIAPAHELDKKNHPAKKERKIIKKIKSTDIYQQAESLFKAGRRDGDEKNTLNLLAGIFGISSLLIGAFVPGLGFALGLAGLVLGIMGVSRGQGLEGLGITGIVAGALWIIVSMLVILLVIALL